MAKQQQFTVLRPFTLRGKPVAIGDTVKGTTADLRNLMLKGYLRLAADGAGAKKAKAKKPAADGGK